jgi:hypothetical protein
MIRTKTQLFNISSKNAENGSFKSQVNIQLPDLTFHHDHVQQIYMSVAHCEVPNSFYIVNYTNNFIEVDNIIYTIPVGNYNASNMITALLALLPVGFSISYSNITNKYTWSHTSAFTINASSPNCLINSVLGLGSVDIASSVSFPYTAILPFVVNFIPLPRINFRSNYFKFNNYSLSDGSSDIFLPLQNNAGQQSMINYVNQTQNKFLITDRNITNFTISVCNDNNQLINFNNVDWYMTMQIDIDYLEPQRNTNFSSILGR